MNNNMYKKVEQLLKICLRGNRKLTLALIISYLVTKVYANTAEEIVNIQEPNKNGISHNKFNEFSINKNETKILNNSKENRKSVSTKKEVEANKNLKGKEADIIITEVTGKNRTNLEGTLEVLGKKADVIIANENGITINGQTFINTNAVTLTTGRYDNSGYIDRKNVFKNFTNVKNDINVKDLGYFASYLQLQSKDGIKIYKDNKDNILLNTDALNIENADSIYFNTGKKRSKRSKRSTDISIDNNANITPRSSREGVQDYENIEVDEEESEKQRLKKEKERQEEKEFEDLINKKLEELIKKYPNKDRSELKKQATQEAREEKYKNINPEEIKKQLDEEEKEAKIQEIIKELRDSGKYNDLHGDELEKYLRQLAESRYNENKQSEANKKKREENAKKEQEELEKRLEAERLQKQKEEEEQRQKQNELQQDQPKDEEQEPEVEPTPKEEKAITFDGVEVSNSSETKLNKIDDKTLIVNIKDVENKNDLTVSHNKYEKFSVKKDKNVILNNNNADKEVNSIIKGIENVKISKNDNLKSAAELIINEVQNGDRSDLEGNLEVAGQKADVVIANKNGISVNGLNVYNINALSLGASNIKADYKKDDLFENASSDVKFESEFKNKNIDININSKGFTNSHDINANNITINSNGNILNTSNIAAEKTLDLKAGDNKIQNENSALLTAKQNLSIESKELLNKNASINTEGNLIIDTGILKNENDRELKDGEVSSVAISGITTKSGVIRAKERLENIKALIYAKDQLVIRTPKLLNQGETKFEKINNNTKHYVAKTRRKEAWYKSWYNGYKIHVYNPQSDIVARAIESTIDSGGNLVITGLKKDDKLSVENAKETYKQYAEADITNKDAAILSKDNMYLKGNVKNETTVHKISVDSLLNETKLDLFWDTQSLVDSSQFDKGYDAKKISLKDFLRTKSDLNYGVYYDLLKSTSIDKVDRTLNLALGGDWKDKAGVDKNNIKYDGSINYLSPTNRATLSAGGRILIEGNVENVGKGDSDYYSNGGTRKNHDQNAEFNLASEDILGDKPQVEKDVIKLDRYIVKENGFYVKSKEKEDKEKYLFKTSEYVKKEDIKVFSTLNSKVEKKADENKVKLIGDDTYQYNMIAKMLKDRNGYKLTPDKERIESLLKSSAEEANRLGLEIGKPLTVEQQAKLRRNIVWYVEKIVDGEKVLTPIVYLLDEEKHRFENQEKVASQILAFDGVITTSENFDNINSTVDGVKEVDITAKKITNIGNKDTDAGISSGGKLKIKATEKLLSEMAGLSALANVDIDAKKVDLKASKVKAGGKVKIKAKEKVTIEDKKFKESKASLENVSTKNHNVETVTSSSTEKSVGSEIEADGIEIETEGKLEVKGSKLKSSKNIKLKGKKVDVLATKTKETVHAKSSSAGIKEGGNLDFNTESTYERETDIINKSKVEAQGRIDIESDEDEDTDIKGSDIKAGKKAKITGKNVNIKNEEKREIVKSSETSTDLLSHTNIKTRTEDITAEKSNVEADEIEAVAEKDVNIVASKLKSKRNYVKGKDGKVNTDSFEETHKSETTSVKLGYTANAGAGAFGVGVKAEADTAEGKASAEAVNEYEEKRDKFRKTGVSLANAEAGIKLSLNHKEREEKKHIKSDIIAEDGFNYLVGKKEVETGGSNIKAKGEVYVEADDIKSTAKKDSVREESTGIDITLKQSAGTTSNVADLINTASEIDEDAKAGQLNKNLAAAKVAGNLTNLLFGDVAGANSRQALALKFKKSKSEIKEDTQSSIESDDNITLAAKNKIELENTRIKANKKASLQAGDDINIKAGKREEKSEKYEFSAEARTQQTSGVSALFGANSQLGAGASADFEIEKKDNLTHKNSEVEGEEFELQSGNNINLEGVRVRGHKDGTTVAKKDLNLKTAVDKKDEYRAKAGVGANISLGAGSNTIGAGNVNASASAGYIYDKGESINERSSITAAKKLGVKVGKNLSSELATVGSDSRQGELSVEGKIITKNRQLKESAGGAIVGISGGITGETGLDIELGDRKTKRVEHKSLIGFNKENIKAKEFEKNGKTSNVDELETENESEVLENSFERGGIANLSFSLKDSKAIAKAGKKAAGKIANKVSETVAKTRKRRSTQQDPTYTLRGFENSQDNGNLKVNEIYQSADSIKRPLPKLPEGSRGQVIEDAAKRTITADTERIYDEIKIPNKADSGFVKNDIYQSTDSIKKATKSDSDRIYESVDDIYTLRTKEQNSEYSTVSGQYDLLKAPTSRPLPKLPEGSRGQVIEDAAKRTITADTERIYDEITTPNKADSGFVKNEIYQSADSIKRPLPKLPEGSRGQVIENAAKKGTVADTERIYDEITTPNKADSGFVKNEIYQSADSIKKPTKADDERIYESVNDNIYTLRTKEQNSEYSTVSGQYDLLKAPTSRPLPKLPEGSRGQIIENATRKGTSADSERIYDEITTPNKSDSGFVKNDIYQSVDSIKRPLPKLPEGSRGQVIENATKKGTGADSERIYDEITTPNKADSGFVKNEIYQSADSIKRPLPKLPEGSRGQVIENANRKGTSADSERIYDEITTPNKADSGFVKNEIYQSADSIKRALPKLPEGSRGQIIENANRKGTSADSERIYDEITTPNKADSGFVKNEIYQSADSIKRALPKLPEGSRGQIIENANRKGTSADTERIYDEITTPNKADSGFVKNEIYQSADSIKRALPKLPEGSRGQIIENAARKGISADDDRIYSEAVYKKSSDKKLSDSTSDLYAKVDYTKKTTKVETEDEKRARINLENTDKYGAKRSIVDPNNPTYLTVQRSKKVDSTEDVKKTVNTEKTYESIDDLGVLTPNKADSGFVKNDIYQSADSIKRALPKLPEGSRGQIIENAAKKGTVAGTERIYDEITTPNKADSGFVKNDIYQSADSIKRALPKLPEGSRGQIIENAAKKGTVADDDRIYSEALSKKSPDQKLNDSTSDLYAKVDYTKKTPKVETEDEKRARINLENTEKYGAKRSIVDPNNPTYLTVQRSKKSDSTQETKKTLNTEKTYETIEDLGVVTPRSKKVGESDYESIDDIRKFLEAPEVEKQYDPSIKALGNTKYMPQQLTSKQKEKLFAKQKQKAAKKNVHQEAIEKLKQIAKEKNIPTEDILRKLEEIAYGYSNEDVIKYVENSAKDGTNIALPDTVDKNKLTNKDRKIIGDVFENTKFSKEYDNFKKNVDNKIFDKLSTNPKFKELINQDLAGNENAIKQLYDLVITAKKDSFKELAGIDIPVPKLVLENKGKDVKYHGHYLENVVTLNIKPPIKAKDKESLNKEILNTIIHELTHHDQANLADNKNNPNLPDGVKGESRLFGVNQDLYVTYDSHYHGYAKQPLEKDAFKSGDSLSELLMKETFNKNEAKGIGNTKYLPKQYTKEEVKKFSEEAKKKNKDVDRAKSAEKKLEIIAKESKKIPKEHLLKAIEQLAYGLSYEDNTALRNKAKETNTKVNRPDTIEGFEGKNVDSFAKIFSNIKFDESYLKVREKVNENIAGKLASNKEFHDLMNQKLSGNAEGIKKLFEIVKKAKADALFEETGIKSKDVELEINEDRGPLSFKQGYYLNNVVNMNKVPIGSFLRTRSQNNKEILDTIIHELTHHDQANFTRNKNSADLNPDIATDLRLLSLNDKYYIESSKSLTAYKKQPVEREAFLSGHKLSDKLIKVIENGYVDPNKKEIKNIEHLGGKVNNLETKREANSKLADNALIYGLKDGRKELIARANKADANKDNAILADSYIGDLNLGYEFSRLSDFAKKVNENKVTDDDIDRIANFVDEGAKQAISDSRNRHNSVNREDNKEIIKELLNNETAVNALKKMDELNKMEQQSLNELKDNNVDIDDLDDVEKYSKEQKLLIENYKSIRNGLNDTRMDFFAEKTKLIAKNTLNNGGTIYFALDGLATDSTRYNNEKTKIDFEKLKDLFDPKSSYYNSVTSKEIRYIYDNFKDHPNIKFTIKDQVIENPFKNIKIEK